MHGKFLQTILWLAFTVLGSTAWASGTAPARVKLEHGTTWYQQSRPGAGPTLILVHGFAISSLIWEKNLEQLHTAGFNVVVYDQYGRGFSDGSTNEYSLDVLSLQLAGLVEVLAARRPLYVVCVSAGCPVAARYAAANPDDLDGLVLVDPQLSPFEAKARNSDPTTAAAEREADLDGLQRHIEAAYADVAARWKKQRTPAFAVALDAISSLQAADDPLREYAALAELKLPLGLILGELDRGQQRRAELMQRLPVLRYYEVAGASHGANYHEPEIFNDLLLRFLSGTMAEREN